MTEFCVNVAVHLKSILLIILKEIFNRSGKYLYTLAHYSFIYDLCTAMEAKKVRCALSWTTKINRPLFSKTFVIYQGKSSKLADPIGKASQTPILAQVLKGGWNFTLV